jgi:hypothetical protein
MVLKKSSQGTMQDGVVWLNGRAASAHDFCATFKTLPGRLSSSMMQCRRTRSDHRLSRDEMADG